MLTSSICHFLLAVGAFQQLQKRRCQIKRLEKMPHGAVSGGGLLDILQNVEAFVLEL
jgi:hypothetical protein